MLYHFFLGESTFGKRENEEKRKRKMEGEDEQASSLASGVLGKEQAKTAGSADPAQGETSSSFAIQGQQMTTMLPTSPNWYCGQVADCSLGGVYAYGAKADIPLLHIKSRKFVGALRGHEDRVTTLEIDKRDGGEQHCVSGAADATVRVWDMRTLQCLAQHHLHKVRPTHEIEAAGSSRD